MESSGTIRVLVTGATGFLGGNVLRALLDHPGIEAVAACRSPEKLPPLFTGEVRAGDLMDSRYREEVVKGVDVVCNAAAGASLWGHERFERERFFEPARDLVECSIRQGVGRFVQASTVAIGHVEGGSSHGDFGTTRKTGFWPHVDQLVDLDHYLRANSHRGTQMVTLRLGHFVGVGNRLGLLPALLPRLRTHLVPWLAGGRKRMPLVGDTDLGRAFALASVAGQLDEYESFNICGPEFPTLRDVIEFVSGETGFPEPHFSVPYPAGYAFGWLMEKLHPVLPGSSPFLTRSIVHLAEDWACSNEYASRKLGYVPGKDWRTAVREHLQDLEKDGYPWPDLSQF